MNAAQIAVPANTCVRLHTFFGHEPQTSMITVANCRIGLCGDLGYDVVSPPSCVGGPLASESPVEVKAVRERAGSVSISWKASIEVTTTSYRIEAVTRKGNVTLRTVPATATGSGTAATYAFTAAVTQLKGARSIEVVALPSGARQGAPVR